MSQVSTAPAPSATRYWRTRLLRPDEDGAMAALSTACFGERADSIEFIRSRYTHSTGPPVHVLVAEAEGGLIGSQAVTLLPFYVGGRGATTGMFTAGMTHPNHRKRGVFREVIDAAERFAFDRGVAFLFTMPNDESLPAFERSPSWKILPDRLLRALPLNLNKLLADRGWPRAASAIAGWLGDARFARRWRSPPATVEERTDLSSLRGELDRLAARVGERYGGVMCRRDWGFVRWRFCENPTFRYRYFVSRGPDGIDGYLISASEHRMGTRVVHMVDWLAAPRPEMIESLLAAAARAAREDGASLLTMIAGGGVEVERFRAFGFRRVPARFAGRRFHTAYALNPAHPELAELASADAAWYLTLGDFDTI